MVVPSVQAMKQGSPCWGLPDTTTPGVRTVNGFVLINFPVAPVLIPGNESPVSRATAMPPTSNNPCSAIATAVGKGKLIPTILASSPLGYGCLPLMSVPNGGGG